MLHKLKRNEGGVGKTKHVKLTASSASTGTCRAVGNLPLPNAAAFLVSTATKTGAEEPARTCFKEATTASAGTQKDEATSVPTNVALVDMNGFAEQFHRPERTRTGSSTWSTTRGQKCEFKYFKRTTRPRETHVASRRAIHALAHLKQIRLLSTRGPR